jgi:hypothetical protein
MLQKLTAMKNRRVHIETEKLVKLSGAPVAQELYKSFHIFNALYFDKRLAAPLILITQSASTRTLGDYTARDVHGLESRIRIAPWALTRGLKFAKDVLLHECIHAWQYECLGDCETGYRGHGPMFASKCNSIGKRLGLPKVGVKGRDGLPRCDYWPMIIRPPKFYPVDFEPSKREPAPTSDEKKLQQHLEKLLLTQFQDVRLPVLKLMNRAFSSMVRVRGKE